jgi:hypothetical protein
MTKGFILFLGLSIHHNHAVRAQCVASAFMTPNTTGNNGSIGLRDWNSDANVTSSNDVYTSVTALLIGDDTHYHVSSNYGFSIPNTAVICGIEVRVERGEGGLLANVTDNSVLIVKGGTITGNEHALAGGWGGADAVATYGSSSDTWGLSWTPADVNASNFGLAFSANLGGVAVLPSARIDQIRIRVWYNNILPVTITHFKATCQGENVLVQWETASETASDRFVVQHSTDGYAYTSIATLTGNGTTNVTHTYAVEHPGAGTHTQNHYRLVQYTTDGDSALVYQDETISCHQQESYMQVLPLNHGQNQVQVWLHGFKNEVTLTLYDLSGNVLYTYAKEITQEHENIQLQQAPDLNSGCYLVVAHSGGKQYTGKLVVVK